MRWKLHNHPSDNVLTGTLTTSPEADHRQPGDCTEPTVALGCVSAPVED
jgi:hypothetical protein